MRCGTEEQRRCDKFIKMSSAYKVIFVQNVQNELGKIQKIEHGLPAQVGRDILP